MKKISEVKLPPESLFEYPTCVMGIEHPFLRTFWFELFNKSRALAHAIYGKWEHVALNGLMQRECPIYLDMCRLKHTFWNDDEIVIQIHPSQSEYVNIQPYTLHLWRWSQTDKAKENTLKNQIINLYDYAKKFYSGKKESMIISVNPKVIAFFGGNDWPEWEDVCEVKQKYWKQNEAAVQFNISSEIDLNSEHLILLWDAVGVELPSKFLV